MKSKIYSSKFSVLCSVFFLILSAESLAQCAATANIHSFSYNGNSYEIISEKKTWANAVLCAVERGGYLVHIDDMAEQQAMFQEVLSVVDSNYVTVNDGGNGSYIWIGANDITTEGNWNWNGNNTGGGIQFWQGDKTGSAVGGKYHNWGGKSGTVLNEPDNYMNTQDVAAMGLKKWPVGFPQVYGVPGEWNDIAGSNQLYFIVEKTPTDVNHNLQESGIRIFPNPVKDNIHISGLSGQAGIAVFTIDGRLLSEIQTDGADYTINCKDFMPGIYLVRIVTEGGEHFIEKIVKE